MARTDGDDSVTNEAYALIGVDRGQHGAPAHPRVTKIVNGTSKVYEKNVVELEVVLRDGDTAIVPLTLLRGARTPRSRPRRAPPSSPWASSTSTIPRGFVGFTLQVHVHARAVDGLIMFDV